MHEYTYSYDVIGNRTDHGGQYDTTRITAFDGCTYATDLDGNVVSRTNCPSGTANATFHWSSDNVLRRMVFVGGDTIEFHYDAYGRLARRHVIGGATRYFLWLGEDLLAEYDGAWTELAEYSYYPGMDNLHALVVYGSPYYAHRDGAGNVLALTDESENVRRRYWYDNIWGGAAPVSGSELDSLVNDVDRARFKGALFFPETGSSRHYESGGLYYMRARWYEPRTGRFLSEDPEGLNGGINPYVFGANDPVNNYDPTGRVCRKVRATDTAPDGSEVTHTKLDCERIGAGDFETIAEFLNRGALGVGDMFYQEALDAWGAGAVGFARNCGGGLTREQCIAVGRSLTYLTLHAHRSCSSLGVGATRRFQAGRFRVKDLPGQRWGHADKFLPRGRLVIDVAVFEEGQGALTYIIAHEARHFQSPFAGHGPLGLMHQSGDSVYTRAQQCAQWP